MKRTGEFFSVTLLKDLFGLVISGLSLFFYEYFMSSGEFGDSFGGDTEGSAPDVSSELVRVPVDKDGVAIVDNQELLVKPGSEVSIPEAIATEAEFEAVMSAIRSQFPAKMLDFVMNPAVKATQKALYAGMPRHKADSLLNDYYTRQFRN